MQVYLEAIVILGLSYIGLSYFYYIFSISKNSCSHSTSLIKEKRSTIVHIIFSIIFINIFWGIFFLFSKLFITSQEVRYVYIASQVGCLLLLQVAKVQVYE
jgi:hypothetical protein